MTNINILKDLTQYTYDSVEGYRNAAKKAESAALRQALERRTDQRWQTLERLNGALQSNGESTVNNASTTGTIHQTFLKVIDALGDSDRAAVKHVEMGEDFLANQFDEALKRDDLDTGMRSLIESVFKDIREGERFTDMLEKQYA
ncbi:PA2169 family four-helix-bundle protein [Erythrobacter sp. GH1-10]|uniref:PA2169 family four-helix-bundle protein n=1 Tax=Erythrobacter sp. GH1-10 TaxID=3349334 RepID=UPI003877CBAD